MRRPSVRLAIGTEAPRSEGKGQTFESCRVRQISPSRIIALMAFSRKHHGASRGRTLGRLQPVRRPKRLTGQEPSRSSKKQQRRCPAKLMGGQLTMWLHRAERRCTTDGADSFDRRV